MIITPATCTDVKSTVVSPSQARKVKTILIQNPSGGSTVAIRFDGGEETLTFANGLLLPAGTERVIEATEGKGSFTNEVEAICDAGQTTDLVIHVIE